LGVYIAVYQIYTRQKFILIGLNHIYNYALILTAPTIVFMILILPLFWFFPAAYKMEGSYLLNVAVMILVAIIFHFRLARCINFKFILDFPLIFRSYSLGFKAFLSEYMAILMTRVDIIILKQLSTFSQLGIYTLAINFVDMIQSYQNEFLACIDLIHSNINTQSQNHRLYITITSLTQNLLTKKVKKDQ